MKPLSLKYHLLTLFVGMLILMTACQKTNDWLDVKKSLGDVTPQTLADYQAILDNNTYLNKKFLNIGLLGTDNLTVANTTYPTLTQTERDAYLWKSTVWDGTSGGSTQWNDSFIIIEYANIVLDGLQKFSAGSQGVNNVKGQALFFRSIAFYNLSQLFCKTYDGQTAGSDLGLPLRTSSDVNIIYQRATLQHTYDQMIGDVKQAVSLLDSEPLNTMRPGKYAALALLAKLYLLVGDYTNAAASAEEVLNHHSTLLDFNSNLVSLSATYRFPVNGLNNPEILFYAQSQSFNSVRPYTSGTSFVDPALYSSYDNNDLRKTLFYVLSGTGYRFRGGYTGGASTFCGLAVDELYLIRAECLARQNNAGAAMADINTLLKSRYKTGTFTDLTAADAVAALVIVLNERRKELPFTGNQRWEDLKRLNKETKFQVTVTRTINTDTYTLLPDSKAYVFPIPQTEIQQSGIAQNDR